MSTMNSPRVTANPIAIYLERTYGYLILDSNMSMPEALVNITIEPSQLEGISVSYNITMDAVYTFLSPNNQLATIGLACPNPWFSTGYEVQIFENESLLPHNLLHYDELVSENETETAQWDFLDFITFNCTLEAGKPTNILVLLDLGTRTVENSLTFQYFVATANSWNGTTHEVIIMNLKNPSIFHSCGFGPNVSLTVVNEPPWKIATWDLNMDAFEDDTVEFATSHKQPFWPVVTPEQLVLGGIVVTLVIGIIVLTFLVGRRTRLF